VSNGMPLQYKLIGSLYLGGYWLKTGVGSCQAWVASSNFILNNNAGIYWLAIVTMPE